MFLKILIYDVTNIPLATLFSVHLRVLIKIAVLYFIIGYDLFIEEICF